MATLLLFVDGIGVGGDDPVTNPFAVPEIANLGVLAGHGAPPGSAFRRLDATLGVPGLPQSATGQTTLFTGVNAAKAIGAHHPGLPGPTLQKILREESMFSKLVAVGLRPTFANGFTRRHLDAARPRFGATTHMVRASGVPLRILGEDAAISHDLTGEWMRKRGVDAPPRTIADAAGVLVSLLEGSDLVLFEYFLTDLVAHRGTLAQRFDQARRVDELVGAVLARAALDRDRIVLFSDHGNLEESHHDRHTRNPVPLLAWGRRSGDLVEEVESFDRLTPALVSGA